MEKKNKGKKAATHSEQPTTETPPSVAAPPPLESSFPIIGVGASAGGLEALELFLENAPKNSGMAFVVIQHLDPTQQGVLPELLQRATEMPVAQITDGVLIEPNHVYVIPPNKDISILHGALHLFAPAEPRGLRLPVDFFFRSLAEDRESHSVGVILSGMGSDGMLGLRAIKEKAGAAFVQDPVTAKFDGMPRSAINAGLADIVAPVEALPAKILAYLKHGPRAAERSLPLESKSQSALHKVFILLRSMTGHDFSQYKESTLYRRIERRMGLHQIDSINAYVKYLQSAPQEAELLFKELLIGVTCFFREPPAWEQLRNEILPSLLASLPSGAVLRAWVAGCSTGEEAYSLAIVFREALDKVGLSENITLQIFASDLDKDAIDKARAGVYPANVAADVTPERLRRFFVQDERGYSICKEVRDSLVFAPHSVCKDPPFTKLDILICRNLLIYLDQVLQKKLLPLFHYSLNPGGILFLGSAETIGGFTDLFSPLDSKNRIYRRLDSTLRSEPVEFPSSFHNKLQETVAAQPLEKEPPLNVQALTEQTLLQRYSPAAVLTNHTGDILYISGRTGKYLEPAVGKANLNIFAMAREGLLPGLSKSFQQALRQKAPVSLKGLRVGANGGAMDVDLTIHPLFRLTAKQGLALIVFSDVAEPVKKAKSKSKAPGLSETELETLRIELQQAKEEAQTTREEMQSSQEELKSTNEELQSTNEELQSSNEELTTSKEEMQSMNEELQTVNNELQAKLNELSRASNDMKNLLNSTDIATLFLDDALRVRRFTAKVATIIKLIPSDVGRPITDVASDLDYPAMSADAQEVLRTLIPIEKPVAASDGRWFLARVMPYRTLENRIDGLVLTFVDISAAKKLEATLRRNELETFSAFQNMPTPMAQFLAESDAAGQAVDCRFVFANDAYTKLLGVEGESLVGKPVKEHWPGEDQGFFKAVGRTLASRETQALRLKHEPSGKSFRCNIYRQDAQSSRVCFLCEDITDS